MDAFVEVVNPDGTQDRFPIEGSQVTLGKSGSAQISVPAARELELEHLLLAPRGKEGCWVSTSQGALTPTMLKGKPFTSGIVPWGSEFSIGRLRIRVTNKRASKDEKGEGVSPVLLIALVVAVGGGAWVMFGKQQAEGIPSGDGIEPPEGDEAADDDAVSRSRARTDGGGVINLDNLAPKLVVEESPAVQVGTEMDLSGGLTIGRSGSNDFAVDDPFVSHMHARILRRGAYHFVEDLGSTNGTFLNDQEVERDARLKVRDTLRIGQTVLRYEE